MERRSGTISKALGDLDFLKFFLFDVLLATVVGLVAWIVTGDDVTSLLISLVIAAILLLVELRFQLNLKAERLATALGFQRQAIEDPFLLDTIPRTIEGYTNVMKSGDPFLVDRAKELLLDCRAEITKLREGYAEVRGEEDIHAILMRVLRDTRKSVFATVFVRIADLWFHGSGKEWLQANFDAVKRGVRITRVFILESERDLVGPVRELIEFQREGGVDVKIAFVRDLSPDVLHDFGLLDEEYVLYLNLAAGSRQLRGGRFYHGESEVRKAKAIRDRILRESEDADDVLKRLPAGGLPAAEAGRPAATGTTAN